MDIFKINEGTFPIKLATWRKYSMALAKKHKCLISRCEEMYKIIVSGNDLDARIVARDGGFELQCVNRGLWWQGCSPIYKRMSSCLAYLLRNYETLRVIYKKEAQN